MAQHRRHRRPTPASAGPRDEPRDVVGLRIVGGRFRGRKLTYSGDLRTRPMKDRVREAVFNLIGTDVVGRHAIDLFAGTGALGLEALSRGAVRATFVEVHFPTAQAIRKNAAVLAVDDVTNVISANVLLWPRRRPDLGSTPWLVFCSPPYEFYVTRLSEMSDLLNSLIAAAPPGSVFVVEADDRFDFGLLPIADRWDVRRYLPAVVGILRVPAPTE